MPAAVCRRSGQHDGEHGVHSLGPGDSERCFRGVHGAGVIRVEGTGAEVLGDAVHRAGPGVGAGGGEGVGRGGAGGEVPELGAEVHAADGCWAFADVAADSCGFVEGGGPRLPLRPSGPHPGSAAEGRDVQVSGADGRQPAAGPDRPLLRRLGHLREHRSATAVSETYCYPYGRYQFGVLPPRVVPGVVGRVEAHVVRAPAGGDQGA
mmetsp:Transcript_133681/g.303192  ORF Transcript_133681/g.303192 Transcript_133681/m.303192 type:complete len:207 (+) Transcript_133681:235-855(+)